MKAKVLFFVTEKLCKVVTKKIDEGKLKYDKNNYYDVDNVKPVMLEHGNPWTFGLTRKMSPFYMLKWNLASPIKMDMDSPDKNFTYYTPKTMKTMSKNATLQTLMTLRAMEGKDMLMWIIIGAVIGYMAGIIFPLSGIVPAG